MLTALLRHCASMATGTSGAEGTAAAPLTCSLCDVPMLSPMLDVEGIETSGGTKYFQLSPQCTENYHRPKASELLMMGYRNFRLPPELPVLLISAELVQISVSLSSFFVFCFARAFLLYPWDLDRFT